MSQKVHSFGIFPRRADAGDVALYIAEEHRDSRIREGLRHDFHGDGFAGAAGAGDQAVPVAHFRVQEDPLVFRKTHIYCVV